MTAYKNPWETSFWKDQAYFWKNEAKKTTDDESILQAKAKEDEVDENELLNCQFDEKRISWRISDSRSESFQVYSKPGVPMLYSSEDDNYLPGLKGTEVFLPEGARVIELCPNTKQPDYIKIIFFWNGRYREGYLYENAFSNVEYYSKTNEYSSVIFINDLERLIFNYNQFKVEGMYYIIDDAVDIINTYLNNVMVSSNVLNEQIAMFNEEYNTLKNGNSVAFIEKIKDFLYPLMNAYWELNDLVICPLTKKFLEDNNIVTFEKGVITYVDPIFKDIKWTLFYDMSNGASGAIYTSMGNQAEANSTQQFKDFIKLIHTNIQKYSPSPEINWIMNQQNYDYIQEDCKNVIIMGEDAWKDISGNFYYKQKYAGFIGIENSLAGLGAPAILTTILHESDQAGYAGLDYLPGDSHVDSRFTKIVFDYFKKKKFTEAFSSEEFILKYGNYSFKSLDDLNTQNEHAYVDLLYQCNTSLSLVFAAAFIKKYLQ